MEKLLSIITFEYYKDLSNHSTEAMGETGLFSIAQAMIIMKGLMGRCLNRKTTLDHLHGKMRLTKEKLNELKTWKVVQEQKLVMVEKARDEFYQRTEELTKVLEEKEKEIRLVKEVAVREYCDSDDLLLELEVSYGDGFDEALRQIKSLYPKLDVSTVKINTRISRQFSPFILRTQTNYLVRMRPSTMLMMMEPMLKYKMNKPVTKWIYWLRRRMGPLLRLCNSSFLFYFLF